MPDSSAAAVLPSLVAASGRAADVTARHLRMLELVPLAPRRTDVATVRRGLDALGFEVTARTVQRDLEALAHRLPELVCDRRSKPFAWCLRRPLPVASSVAVAVALVLLDRIAGESLPDELRRALALDLTHARFVVEQRADAPLVRWLRTVPLGRACASVALEGTER